MPGQIYLPPHLRDSKKEGQSSYTLLTLERIRCTSPCRSEAARAASCSSSTKRGEESFTVRMPTESESPEVRTTRAEQQGQKIRDTHKLIDTKALKR
jgi:hypothetical protein